LHEEDNRRFATAACGVDFPKNGAPQPLFAPPAGGANSKHPPLIINLLQTKLKKKRKIFCQFGKS